MSLIPRQTDPSLFFASLLSHSARNPLNIDIRFACSLICGRKRRTLKGMLSNIASRFQRRLNYRPRSLARFLGQYTNDVSREETTNFWWREEDCVNLILRRECPKSPTFSWRHLWTAPWWIIVINGRARRKACHKLRSPSRQGIVRGFFHRENRILFRKSQIFDLDT